MVPRIIFGEDSLSYLKSLSMSKCLIVTDRMIEKTKLLPNLKSNINERVETMVFSDFGAEPSYHDMTRSIPEIIDFAPDHIVALGGGSVMDTSKMILFRYARPDTNLYDLKPSASLGLKQKAKLIAVPTTSGTGSECSWASIIMDEEKNRKVEMGSLEILPDYAILDPSMVLELPIPQTVSTSVDAITHAIEAYVSNQRNFYSDAFAEKALELVTHNILHVLENPSNIEARNAVHIGASMAGVAFSNSQIGLAHALGHALGAMFKIPHGTTVGIFLPKVLEFNDKVVQDRHQRLNDVFPQSIRGSSLLESVKSIFRKMGQPAGLVETGIDRNQYEDQVPRLETLTMKSIGIAANPRQPDLSDVREILLSV